MIHSVKFTYVLDTNVIYPIEIRDLNYEYGLTGFQSPSGSVTRK